MLLQVSLFLGEGTKLPLLLVNVAVQDDTLGAGDNTVVASSDGRSCHLGNGESDSFALGGDENDLLANLDVGLVAKHSGQHELSSVAHSVDRSVLHDDALVAGEEDLEGHDHAPEVRVVVVLVEVPLSILHIVHRHHGLVLLERTTAHTPKLLHVGTAAKQVAEMDAESSHIGASFAADPEDAHVAVLVVLDQLGLVDRPDSELLLDGGDQGRPLEAGPFERVESLLQLLDLVERLVQLDYSHVLFTSRLLGFHEARCIVDTNDEAASDLWIQCARMSSFVDFEDFLDPGDDLVRRGVRWLVEVDDTVGLKDVDGSIGRRVATREWCEVRRLDVQLVEVLDTDNGI